MATDPWAGTEFASPPPDDPWAGTEFSSTSQEPAPQELEAEGRSALEGAKDLGISALQGAILLPESVVGLADLAATPFRGEGDSTFTEDLAGIGVDFKGSREILGEMKSDGSRIAREDINAAFDESMLAGLGELIDNPLAIAEGVIQSVPQMLGAAGIVRMGALRIAANAERAALAGGATAQAARRAGQSAVKAATPRLQALGAATEGAQVAGVSGAEYAAEGELGSRQATGATAQGLSTGAITMALNRLGARVGLEDVETALGAGSSTAGPGSRVLKGAIREGPLEEGLQSTAETGIGNITDERPVGEGLGQSYVEGSVMGAPLGAGGALLSKPQQANDPVSDKEVQDELDRLEQERLAAEEFSEVEQAEAQIEKRERQKEIGQAAGVAAAQAAAEVELQGGDSLDALNAGTEAERQYREQAATVDYLDRLNTVDPTTGPDAPRDLSAPDAPTDTTRPSVGSTNRSDAIQAEIIRAEREGRDNDAVRLGNAQRMYRTADRFEADGRATQAANFRKRADGIVNDIMQRNIPQQATLSGEVEQAEQVQAAPPPQPQPVTLAGAPQPRPALPGRDPNRAPDDQVIFGQPPQDQSRAAIDMRAQEREAQNTLAMEGTFQPGQPPVPPAPLRAFGSEVPAEQIELGTEQTADESFTDADFPQPAGEQVDEEISDADYDPAVVDYNDPIQAARVNREMNETLRPLEGRVVSRAIEDGAGGTIAPGRPVAPEVRRVQKRMGVMDQLLRCFNGG